MADDKQRGEGCEGERGEQRAAHEHLLHQERDKRTLCQESGSEIGFYNRAHALEKMFDDDSIMFKSKPKIAHGAIATFASNKSEIRRP